MADAVQVQEVGGGEGAPPVANPPPANPQEPKSAETEVVKEQNKEIAAVIPIVNSNGQPTQEDVKSSTAEPAIEPKQEDVKSSTAEPAVEQKQDVKSSAVEPAVEQKQDVKSSAVEPVIEQKQDVKSSAVEPAVEQKQDIKSSVAEPTTEGNANKTENSAQPNESGNWQQREMELLKKIEELEKVKTDAGSDGLKLELKVREEEIDLLKARVRNLETELQAALSKPGPKNQEMIDNIKQQHEDLLSKARGMIFDKTKMVKNQELQIEALTTQVQSLKDINVITKDLLEIRNSEVKAMEERLQAMEARFKAEKDRFGLVLQRAQTSSNINDDLRKEYETQLAIFKELREKYEQRVQALVAENNRLKETAAKGGPSG